MDPHGTRARCFPAPVSGCRRPPVRPAAGCGQVGAGQRGQRDATGVARFDPDHALALQRAQMAFRRIGGAEAEVLR